MEKFNKDDSLGFSEIVNVISNFAWFAIKDTSTSHYQN